MTDPYRTLLEVRQLRRIAQESKETYGGFSTGCESASRKLGDAWGCAKGCKSNLA